MAAALVFYGALAAAALWATCRDRDLVWIGLWLAVNYTLSNVLFFTAPVELRPGPYTFFETMVAVAAFCAWAVHRLHSGTEARLLVGIVTLNALSICANIALATISSPGPRQIYAFEATTNIIYASECVLTLGVGLLHGIRVGRFRRGPVARWVFARLHVVGPRGSRR